MNVRTEDVYWWMDRYEIRNLSKLTSSYLNCLKRKP